MSDQEQSNLVSINGETPVSSNDKASDQRKRIQKQASKSSEHSQLKSVHEIYDQLDDEFEHSQSAKSQEHNSSGHKLCGVKRRASKSLVMDQDHE